MNCIISAILGPYIHSRIPNSVSLAFILLLDSFGLQPFGQTHVIYLNLTRVVVWLFLIGWGVFTQEVGSKLFQCATGQHFNHTYPSCFFFVPQLLFFALFLPSLQIRSPSMQLVIGIAFCEAEVLTSYCINTEFIDIIGSRFKASLSTFYTRMAQISLTCFL